MPVIARSSVPIQTDPNPLAARIGLIALATDHTAENDFARICDPHEVGVYVTRIDYDNPTTPENLHKTGPRLTQAAAQILPGEQMDVIAYACTSASIVLGEEAVSGFIAAGRPEATCVTPASAALAAFSALGVQRISVLTPYNEEVTRAVSGYFTDHGLSVSRATYLDFLDDRKMARISLESIVDAGMAAMAEDSDALFLSCTALRSAACVDVLEKRLGKPVITSNQAMAWRSLRLVSNNQAIPGFGRLLTLP